MRLFGLTLLAFTATGVLTLFWRMLGAGQSYWDNAPLGIATILMFTVMASLISVGLDPVNLDADEADAAVQVLPLRPVKPAIRPNTTGGRRIGEGVNCIVAVRPAPTTAPPRPPRSETRSRACG